MDWGDHAPESGLGPPHPRPQGLPVVPCASVAKGKARSLGPKCALPPNTSAGGVLNGQVGPVSWHSSRIGRGASGTRTSIQIGCQRHRWRPSLPHHSTTTPGRFCYANVTIHQAKRRHGPSWNPVVGLLRRCLSLSSVGAREEGFVLPEGSWCWCKGSGAGAATEGAEGDLSRGPARIHLELAPPTTSHRFGKERSEPSSSPELPIFSHRGGLAGVPGSWFWTGSALVIVAFWGVNSEWNFFLSGSEFQVEAEAPEQNLISDTAVRSAAEAPGSPAVSRPRRGDRCACSSALRGGTAHSAQGYGSCSTQQTHQRQL
nr:uncharacterized protein LOC127490071 [Oryctolagus cuniculus]